jgi:hypothetical protein
MTEQEKINELTKCSSRFSPITARASIRCNFRCEYCGKSFLNSIEDYDTWQWDHLEPVANGGSDDERNGAIACKLCNFMKRAFCPSRSLAELCRAPYIAEVRAFLSAERQKKLGKLNDVRRILGLNALPADASGNSAGGALTS